MPEPNTSPSSKDKVPRSATSEACPFQTESFTISHSLFNRLGLGKLLGLDLLGRTLVSLPFPLQGSSSCENKSRRPLTPHRRTSAARQSPFAAPGSGMYRDFLECSVLFSRRDRSTSPADLFGCAVFQRGSSALLIA